MEAKFWTRYILATVEFGPTQVDRGITEYMWNVWTCALDSDRTSYIDLSGSRAKNLGTWHFCTVVNYCMGEGPSGSWVANGWSELL